MAVKSKGIKFKIDAKMLDELYLVRLQMKKSSVYRSKVMAICLLGEKDGIVDTFIPMITNKGCWDSPEISYDMFDLHFRKLIEMDRVCVGMAMIRPDHYDETISNDLRNQIHGWRKAFADISKTIWLSVSQHNIIPYKVVKESSRIYVRELTGGNLYKEPGKSKLLKIADVRKITKGINIEDRRNIELFASKLEKCIERGTSGVRIIKSLNILKKDIVKIHSERAVREKQRKIELAKKTEQAAKVAQENLRIAAERNDREKAAKKHCKDIGHGLILIKDKHGREILWQK